MKNLSLPRPEAVLFDFDGILVDSEPMHHRAYDQEALDLLLRLDGEEEFVIYLASVGKKAPPRGGKRTP